MITVLWESTWYFHALIPWTFACSNRINILVTFVWLFWSCLTPRAVIVWKGFGIHSRLDKLHSTSNSVPGVSKRRPGHSPESWKWKTSIVWATQRRIFSAAALQLLRPRVQSLGAVWIEFVCFPYDCWGFSPGALVLSHILKVRGLEVNFLPL